MISFEQKIYVLNRNSFKALDSQENNCFRSASDTGIYTIFSGAMKMLENFIASSGRAREMKNKKKI